MIPRFIRSFYEMEAGSSILLILVAVIAMCVANSPLLEYYQTLHTHAADLIIKEGLMTLFFLVVGIEIKYEILKGALSKRGQILLPAVAAMGGVILPAFIFICFNMGQESIRGWAIPCATDIAFALGVLALFGKRIPPALRTFLLAVAVIDDIIAVVIIALFYSTNISVLALIVCFLLVALLYFLNKKETRTAVFLIVGCALWISMLQCGIDAALAGVVLGMLMPLQQSKPLFEKLNPWVAFLVVPIFAFANAGVPLDGNALSNLSAPLPLGIVLGLFIGKQIGIFVASWGLIRSGRASLPDNTNWKQFYATCIIAGIGFTMSLFVGSLAFQSEDMLNQTRIGVLVGSLASAVAGSAMLAVSCRRK